MTPRAFGHSKRANDTRIDWLIKNYVPYRYNRCSSLAEKILFMERTVTEMRQAGLYSPKTVNADICLGALIDKARAKIKEKKQCNQY